jgi:hypothetical protein
VGKRSMLALSAAAVMLLSLPMARSASADDGWVKVPVRFGPAGVHALPPGEACDSSSTYCVDTEILDRVDVIGDLTGVSQQALTFSYSKTAGWFASAGTGWFEGTVTTCGKGAILFSVHVEGDGSAGPIPATYTFHAGSGTGDLKTLSGTATDQPDGSIAGVLRCRRPHH